MTALVDTNVLVAQLFARDIHHTAAKRGLAAARQSLVVAAPTLVELSFVLLERVTYSRMIQGIRSVRATFEIVPLTGADQDRLEAIMEQYQTARFDYTDAAIMALSERLNITQIYTFDHRDFVIFRPRHCPALELLP